MKPETLTNCGHRGGDMYEALVCPGCERTRTAYIRELEAVAEAARVALAKIEAQHDWGDDDDARLKRMAAVDPRSEAAVALRLRAALATLDASQSSLGKATEGDTE